MDKKFVNTFSYKVVYICEAKNSPLHNGYLKIGDATLDTDLPIDKLQPNTKPLIDAAIKRINSYMKTSGLVPNVLWVELAIRTVKDDKDNIKIEVFRDHKVHDVLKNSNIYAKDLNGVEWYKVDIVTAKHAIDAVKKDIENLSNTKGKKKHTPIVFQPAQIECINKVKKHFKKSDRFLMNAKMRYGKTLVSLQIVKECKFEKTIIVTHRPVVNNGWFKDFNKIFYGTNYVYGSKENGNSVEKLLKLNKKDGKKIIYFASVQDLRGSATVGGIFDKNNSIFKTVWDCLIVDEAHEGTTTELGEETVNAVFKEGKGTKRLDLSGTPFNILHNFDDDSIFTWDYIMEQEQKSEWDKYHFGAPNPYDELPELKIYTYSLGDILNNKNYISVEDKAFNFKEFFRTYTGDIKQDFCNMPATSKIGDFVYEKEIKSFLNLMTKEGSSQYPFSSDEYRSLFKHTLWMVPGIKEAKALSKLMRKHPVFKTFGIVNVAGNGDEEDGSAEAFTKVMEAIEEAGEDGYTITLSCGKLTTGVTVPEWTAVFMLAGSYSTSAANYLQTIFRVQSPCNKHGKIKQVAYVFDFAPDRTLKMITSAVSVSSKAGKGTANDAKILGRFLNFCPVISITGSEMSEFSATRLLQELKKAYAERVVRNGFADTKLYNEELFKLTEVEIKKFNDLKDIVGTSKAQPKKDGISLSNNGLTDEEHEEHDKLSKKPPQKLSKAEKARLEELKRKKALRVKAINILRAISIRMPLLIFGIDIPYEDDLTLDDFINKVDDTSWVEFMPSGVTKKKFKEFQKYYDQEIFIAAGRQIRNIAKAADTLEPTERVKKIASLFSFFKNPDKETVLTPWRVVNLHMSESLGGWDFWDNLHEETLDEPRFENKGKITKETFYKDEPKILEINSKTGLYPLYVAYSCYRKKLEKINKKEVSISDKQKTWNKTIQNNIFVICKTPMAKAITQRTLMGYQSDKINAHCFDDLVSTLKNKPEQFKKRVLRENFWGQGSKDMKFDAIVGNPPYQESKDNTSDNPIYHLFMDCAYDMSDRVSFITPARFLFKMGKTPKDWNEKMLNDEHLNIIKYESDSRNIFPNVDIKGGIVITLRDKNTKFGKIGQFVASGYLKSIVDKVNSFNLSNLSELVYSPESYKFSKTVHKEHKGLANMLSGGHLYDITSNIFEKTGDLLFVDEVSDTSKYVRFYGRENNTRVYKYIKKKYIDKHENLDFYKVFLPKSNGSGRLGETLSSPVVGLPSDAHTQTFISIGKFKTKFEAASLNKYLHTKFLRVLLNSIKVTQDNKKEVWKNIPILDFTKKSEIDWTKPIKEIDEQLFAKFKLNDEEINFIKETALEMKLPS